MTMATYKIKHFIGSLLTVSKDGSTTIWARSMATDRQAYGLAEVAESFYKLEAEEE